MGAHTENQVHSDAWLTYNRYLSDRERDVLELVAAGLTDKQIGHRLDVSERTARNHTSNLLEKFCVQNRDTVAIALTAGLGRSRGSGKPGDRSAATGGLSPRPVSGELSSLYFRTLVL